MHSSFSSETRQTSAVYHADGSLFARDKKATIHYFRNVAFDALFARVAYVIFSNALMLCVIPF